MRPRINVTLRHREMKISRSGPTLYRITEESYRNNRLYARNVSVVYGSDSTWEKVQLYFDTLPPLPAPPLPAPPLPPPRAETLWERELRWRHEELIAYERGTRQQRGRDHWHEIPFTRARTYNTGWERYAADFDWGTTTVNATPPAPTLDEHPLAATQAPPEGIGGDEQDGRVP